MARQPYFTGNYGSALSSTANAANFIARAGQTQGQMFANLGNIAADTLEKFREKKEEKKRQDDFITAGKRLPYDAFSMFGVKNEEEKNELLKTLSKPENRSDALMLARFAEERQTRQGQQQFRNLIGTTPQTDPQAFRKRVAELTQSGQLNPLAQDLAMNRFMQLQAAEQARQVAQAERKAKLEDEKAILRFKEDLKRGDESKVPGDPIYKKRVLDTIGQIENLIEDESFMGLANEFLTGLPGAIMKNIPGTDAFDMAKLISTVEASIGFDRLQKMRDDSSTGGALGQVSNIELELLKSSLANLEQSQSMPQFKTNLEAVKKHYQNSVAAIELQRKGVQFPTEENVRQYLQNQSAQDGKKTTVTQEMVDELKKVVQARKDQLSGSDDGNKDSVVGSDSIVEDQTMEQKINELAEKLLPSFLNMRGSNPKLARELARERAVEMLKEEEERPNFGRRIR